MMKTKSVIMLGMGGHSLVSIDILMKAGYVVEGYVDIVERAENPLGLRYIGNDNYMLDHCAGDSIFIAIGSNLVRSLLFTKFCKDFNIVNAIHPNVSIGLGVSFGAGVFISSGSVINPMVKIGDGVICNTQTSIDHECSIDDFAHIAPGVVLCGGVKIGKNTFVGANSVIKEGIKIGANVVIGAGSVIVRDVADGHTVYGNPGKIRKS